MRSRAGDAHVDEVIRRAAPAAGRGPGDAAGARAARRRRAAARHALPRGGRPEPMAKNLVIVESPAKAKTLGKYLGRDYQVKASVGHVVDLPKSKLGVDIENDFEPEYHGHPRQDEGHRRAQEGGQGQGQHLPGARPRPRGRGDRLAHRRRSSGTASEERPPRPLQRDHQEGRAGGASSIRASSTRTSSTRSRRAACSTAWSATSSRRCSGRRCAAGCRPGACSRSRCASSSSASARSGPSSRRSTGRSRRGSRAAQPPPFAARLVEIDGEKLDHKQLPPRRNGDAVDERPRRPRRRDVDRHQGRDARSGAATRRRRSSPRACSRRRRASSASSPSAHDAHRAAALRGRRARATRARSVSSPTCVPTRRASRARRIAAVREFIAAALRRASTCPRSRTSTARRRTRRTRTRRSGRRRWSARPSAVAPLPRARTSSRSTRSSGTASSRARWRRRSTTQTTVDIEAATLPLPRHRPGRSSSTASSASTPRARTTRTGRRRRGRRGRSCPPLTEGEALQLLELAARAALHAAAAALHAGDAHQGARGEGHRPPVDVRQRSWGRSSTRSTSSRTTSGGCKPTELGMLVTDLLVESFPDILNVEFTAGMEDELDAHRGGQGALGRRRCAASTTPFAKDLERAEVEMRDVKREERPTDLVCERCGKPMVIKWGRARRVPRLQRLPRVPQHQELHARRGRHDQVVEARDRPTETCEKCGKPMQVRFGRFGKFLGCSGYPGVQERPAAPQAGADRHQVPRCAARARCYERRSRARQDLLQLQPLPGLQVRGLGQARPRAVSAVRAPFVIEKVTKRSGTVRRCAREGCDWMVRSTRTRRWVEMAVPGRPRRRACVAAARPYGSARAAGAGGAKPGRKKAAAKVVGRSRRPPAASRHEDRARRRRRASAAAAST